MNKGVPISIALCLAVGGIFYLQHEIDRGDIEEQFEDILLQDDMFVNKQQQFIRNNSLWSGARLKFEEHRLESAYKRFLNNNPRYTRAKVAYGSFLYDQGHENQAVDLWEQAIHENPSAPHAYNNLANHYSHIGRIDEALRYYQKAYELEPNEAIFRFNWATTCIMLRKDAGRLYGWDEKEIFRKSLEQFRIARDLAPQDYSLATSYAETFYMIPDANWKEAYEAWKYCLTQPITDQQMQVIYGHLATMCMNLKQYEEARTWIQKMEADEVLQVRKLRERRLAKLTAVSASP